MKLKIAGWGEGVCGHDFAGVIEQLGPDVSTETRKVGQRVAGWVDACT